MNSFKTYHPLVNFVYFTLVIIFSMLFMHPICLMVSLSCGFIYSVMLNGMRAAKFNLMYMLPMLAAAAIINPAFNHEGTIIITYLPNGNPLTFESVIYGVASSVMLISVICWFSCYNEIMTSDKFICLFGKIIPSASLVLSMTLRFIPRFKTQIKVISTAQRCIGRDISNGNIILRAKHGLSILSVMMTWALENSIETADSMKCRGYGLPGRTAYSVFNFSKRDASALFIIIIMGIYVLAGKLSGGIYFRYFPSIRGDISAYGISVVIAYFALCVIPVVIELREKKKWKYIKSKI